MPRFAWLILVALVSLTALTPVGLCPCWLMADVRAYHPHPDGHPERPHGHGYLLELFDAQPVAIVVVALIPAHDLVMFLAHGSLWQWVMGLALGPAGWVSPPIKPPPRLIFLS